MSYLVLARKYRPQNFEEVVRQEHITRALANALTSDRLAHAILLAGPRGTGKTTIARILAKCVNCETGPTATPCNTCRSCREITGGHAADVFEIDGASNNRVENIRELRENANYMPAHSRFKIYIIDEVHMLSDSAFNALLKILEEPPAHVKFFFATTDPNKIPITILSRCQRHDCRRVDLTAIVQHLARLCENETVEITEDALTLIGREADGSIRDALSLLDLIITGATGKITAELVLDVLGGLDRQSLFDISQAVFDRDAGKIIDIIARLYDRGQNMIKLFAEVLTHFRNLLVVKMGGTSQALSDVSEYELNAIKAQVSDISQVYLHQILDVLFKEEIVIRQSSSPRLALEMAFVRIIQIRPALPIDTLIEKIDILQKNLAKNLPLAPPPAATQEAIKSPAPAPPAPAGPESRPAPAPKQPAPKQLTPKQLKPEQLKPAPEVPECPNQAPDPAAGPAPPPPRPENNAKKTEPLETSWKNIICRIAEENPALAACFSTSKMVKTGDGHVEIRFATNKFNVTYANRDGHQALIQKTCSLYFSDDIQVSLAGTAAASRNGLANKQKSKQLEAEALNHPLVADAMRIFNGKIVDIKILQEA